MSASASDDRLEISMEVSPAVRKERVPTRTFVLRFRNLGGSPLRLYLPLGEGFRSGISTIFVTPEEGPPLFVPEPRPHGYVVTEKDFALLEPEGTYVANQSFTLEAFARGGKGTARREGFEDGRTVQIHWTYRNEIRRWAGGARTWEGLTAPLFGGTDIPGIWIGELGVDLEWTVPAP